MKAAAAAASILNFICVSHVSQRTKPVSLGGGDCPVALKLQEGQVFAIQLSCVVRRRLPEIQAISALLAQFA